MGDSRRKIERSSGRMQVVPQEIRGLMTIQGTESQQPFLIWDVSETGIGIWTSEEVTPEQVVILTIGQPHLLVVEGQIIWSERQGEDQGFRCGIRAADSDKPFQTLIREFKKIHSNS